MLINTSCVLTWLHFSLHSTFISVLCVISKRGGGMGETDRLCFKRFAIFTFISLIKLGFKKCLFKWVECEGMTTLLPFVDMTGIIPEDEEEQDMYDDVGHIDDNAVIEPNEDDIYEELPGLTVDFHHHSIFTDSINCMCFFDFVSSLQRRISPVQPSLLQRLSRPANPLLLLLLPLLLPLPLLLLQVDSSETFNLLWSFEYGHFVVLGNRQGTVPQ